MKSSTCCSSSKNNRTIVTYAGLNRTVGVCAFQVDQAVSMAFGENRATNYIRILVELPILPVPQRKSPWQHDELKLFAGVAQGISGVVGNPTAGLVQGVADHPTLLKPQGVSAKSMVGESKAVSVQASVVEANCTNIDVCPELL